MDGRDSLHDIGVPPPRIEIRKPHSKKLGVPRTRLWAVKTKEWSGIGTDKQDVLTRSRAALRKKKFSPERQILGVAKKSNF